MDALLQSRQVFSPGWHKPPASNLVSLHPPNPSSLGGASLISDESSRTAYETPSNTVARLTGAYGSSYQFHEEPVSSPRAGEALVRLEFTGVCHGDVYSRDGGGPAPPSPIRPLTGGHEGIGHIVSFGVDVAESTDLRIGDTVGIAWRYKACGSCPACQEGVTNHCPRQIINGLHRNGTFQYYMCYPASQLVRIPSGLPKHIVCPILCAGVTAFTALRKMAPVRDRWLVIVGAAGGLGHLAIQYAKGFFGLKVLSIDGGSAEKESFCRRLGSDEYIDFEKFGQGMVDEVIKRTQGGAHYTLVLGPHQSAYDAAGQYSRFRGQVMAIGIGNCHFPLRPMLVKDLTVRSSQTGNEQDMADALQASLTIGLQPVIEILPLKELNETLDRIHHGQVMGKLIISLHEE